MRQSKGSQISLRSVTLMLALAVGCTGSLDDPERSTPKTAAPQAPSGATRMPGGTVGGGPTPGGGGAGVSNMPGPGDNPAMPPAAVGAACGPGKVGPAPLRRLTRAELNNSLRDLLGDNSRAADKLPAQERDGVFDNDIGNLGVGALFMEQWLSAIDTVVATASMDKSLTKLLPCDLKVVDDACLRKFIDGFGRRAFRRPVATAEVDDLLGTYTLGKATGDFHTGMQYLLAHMLSSPHFLYRVEMGEVSASGAARRLSPFEIATRLSYLISGSTPDDALLATAAAGRLATREQILVEVKRLLRGDGTAPSPGARANMNTFFGQWLGLRDIDKLGKDSTKYPDFGTLRGLLRKEGETFLDDLFWNKGAVSDVVTASHSYLNARLGQLYGVTGVEGADFRRVMLDQTQRAGILTQGGIMALTSGPTSGSPIKRGLFVRDRILCTEVPPPPVGVNQNLPMGVFKTARERYAAHSADPSCVGCHRLLDPLGFAYDVFDATGAYRAQDSMGIKYDTSGQLVSSDVDGPFAGAVELAGRLGKSAGVQSCALKHVFRFAVGRDDAEADSCALEAMGKRVAATGGRLEDLLLAVVENDAFFTLPPSMPAATSPGGKP